MYYKVSNLAALLPHWPVLYLTIQGKQTLLNPEVRDEKHLKVQYFLAFS